MTVALPSSMSVSSQSVDIDGNHSEMLNITSGAPQGSAIGPLLHLVCVNDIVDVVNSGIRICLFAADCLVL